MVERLVKMADTTRLNISKLGTKTYWDDFYALERANFNQNPDDTGECWFDDNDAERRMVDFLLDNVGEQLIDMKSSMIDLGTGNGHLLFELCENGFSGPMLGVDYSSESVAFAHSVSKVRQFDAFARFEAADIFQADWCPGKFDIVLDKGTLDAIALSGLQFENHKTVFDCYSEVIEKILNKNGVFLITSCNFSEDELVRLIQTKNLVKWKSIKYPSFEFGGVKGTAICSVAFFKR